MSTMRNKRQPRKKPNADPKNNADDPASGSYWLSFPYSLPAKTDLS